MRNNNNVAMDRARFYEALMKRGTNAKKAAVKIGMNENYFYVRMGIGSVPKHVAVLLESVFGIKKSEYEPMPEIKRVEPPKEAENTVGMDVLYKMIFSAVYEATRKGVMDAHRVMEAKKGGKNE